MPDEIEVVTAFPDIIEVIITDLNKLVEKLLGKARSFTLPEATNLFAPIKFDYTIDGSARLPGFNRSEVPHDIRTVTVETLLAGEITSRVGVIIREVLLQNVEARVPAGGPDEPPRADAPGGGISRERLLEILDLSNDYPDSEAHRCEFAVLDIELKSPLRMRSRVAAIMLQVQVLTTPATTAEIGTAIAAASLALQTIDVGCSIMSCKMPQNTIETVRQEASDQRYLYYLRMIDLKDLQPIQYDLRVLGFYNNAVDNLFEEDSNQARMEFAISQNLNPNILPTDPAFLRALANAIAKHEYPDTSGHP